jgi:hypothetical protein
MAIGASKINRLYNQTEEDIFHFPYYICHLPLQEIGSGQWQMTNVIWKMENELTVNRYAYALEYGLTVIRSRPRSPDRDAGHSARRGGGGHRLAGL